MGNSACLSYAVVTPARDDGQGLRRLGECLLRQTEAPAHWLIVDDGSRDETFSVASMFATCTPWVSVVRKRGRPFATRGAPIAEAFEFGLAELPDGYDIVVRADADVSMDRDFFSRLLVEFERDSELGIASGSRIEHVGERWRQRHVTGISVEAQCRAYRATCLSAVLPLDRHRGWDGVDVVQAHLHGWRTRVVPDLPFRHHRAIGARDGARLRAWIGEGMASYSMGYRPLYLLARALHHAAIEPAAVGLPIGYLIALAQRNSRAHRDVRRFVRREQTLRKLPARGREAYGKRVAKREPRAVDLMLVAEPGGHLLELHALRPVWKEWTRTWVTLDGPDSASLLCGESVVRAHGPTCRSSVNLVRNLLVGWQAIRRYRPRLILATGSGVAVPLIWLGRIRGIKTIYVECGGRIDRPSLSCRLVARVVDRLYVQWPDLMRALPSARYAGTIRWDIAQSRRTLPEAQRHLFATVGTSTVYPFDRLVRAVGALSSSHTVAIQRGVSSVRPNDVDVVDFLTFDELLKEIDAADVVVTHGGIGSVLTSLGRGKQTIVIPRRQELNESVDDHQIAFARKLEQAGLVVVATDERELRSALLKPVHPPAERFSTSTLTDELVRVVGDLLSAQSEVPRAAEARHVFR